MILSQLAGKSPAIYFMLLTGIVVSVIVLLYIVSIFISKKSKRLERDRQVKTALKSAILDTTGKIINICQISNKDLYALYYDYLEILKKRKKNVKDNTELIIELLQDELIQRHLPFD